MNIAVITAAVGLKEGSLYDPKPTISSGYTDYFVFSDIDIPEHYRWKSRKIFVASQDEDYEARRSAKIPKMLAHYLLPEYDYYIWHDYTHKVAIDPEKIIENYLGDNDFAFFKHPQRDSWDTELEEVRRSNLDHGSLLDIQKNHYNEVGVKKNQDFYECTCFVRRNNEIANKTCSLWYDHATKFSSRDQVSLPAAIQKYNPKISIMPGTCQIYYGNNEIIPQFRHSLRIQNLIK